MSDWVGTVPCGTAAGRRPRAPSYPRGTGTEEQQMTGDARPGARILGSLRSADGQGVVRIEGSFDTDISDLWSAITDPGRLARWHGQVDGDLSPGGRFRVYNEADDIESTGRVEACEPPRRLVVTNRE